MAKNLTPEEAGMKILEVFSAFSVKAGEMLLLKTITMKLMTTYSSDEVESGFNWLGEMGYIEQKEGKSKDAIFLTEAGFAARP